MRIVKYLKLINSLKYGWLHSREWMFIVFVVISTSVVTYCNAWGSAIDSMTITLNANNESINNLFKKIEEQTGYTLLTDGNLQRNVTIRLRNFPLGKGIKRMLSGLNYSVLCDEQKKIIQIAVFPGGKQNRSSGMVVAGQGDYGKQGFSSMSGASAAIASYKAGEVEPLPEGSDNVVSSMSGVSTAIASYKAGEVEALPDGSPSVVSSMSGASAAIASYKAGEVASLPEQSPNVVSSMSGASAAIEEYKKAAMIRSKR